VTAGWTKYFFVSHNVRPVVVVNLEKEQARVGWAFLIEKPFGI
jgi:hypothetical protein